MSRKTQQVLLVVLSMAFVAALLLAQYREVTERRRRAGLQAATAIVPARSRTCVECHGEDNPGIVQPWRRSAHAAEGIGCVDCHEADPADADGYEHYGERIATIVTPRDCARCHPEEAEQYARSRHARPAALQPSSDADVVRTAKWFTAGADRTEGQPRHARPAGAELPAVAWASCESCHGSTVALLSTGGALITVEELQPDDAGKPTKADAVAQVARNADGIPKLAAQGWPNTGVGRRNLDGSRGSCGACHGRHDFARARARQPESCGRCHHGVDQPQLEVFLASKHGAAWRSAEPALARTILTGQLGRDGWVAPTCATCHLSGHSRNGAVSTHDPGERLSWTHRPELSQRRDTDAAGAVLEPAGGSGGRGAIADSWQDKRKRMRDVCLHCHGASSVAGFYEQYDAQLAYGDSAFVAPAQRIMSTLRTEQLLTPTALDEPEEWSWFELWHRHVRRARMGAAMMSPEDVHGRGFARAAATLYGELVGQAAARARQADALGNGSAAERVRALLPARGRSAQSPSPAADSPPPHEPQ